MRQSDKKKVSKPAIQQTTEEKEAVCWTTSSVSSPC